MQEVVDSYRVPDNAVQPAKDVWKDIGNWLPIVHVIYGRISQLAEQKAAESKRNCALLCGLDGIYGPASDRSSWLKASDMQWRFDGTFATVETGGHRKVSASDLRTLRKNADRLFWTSLLLGESVNLADAGLGLGHTQVDPLMNNMHETVSSVQKMIDNEIPFKNTEAASQAWQVLQTKAVTASGHLNGLQYLFSKPRLNGDELDRCRRHLVTR